MSLLDRFFRVLIVFSLSFSTLPASFSPNRVAAAKSIDVSDFAANRSGRGISTLSPHQPKQAPLAALATVPITITAQGFIPAVATVTLGTTVVWSNLTGQTVTMRSGQPFRVYLPLVIKGAGNLAIVTDKAILAPNDDFTSVIPPGGTFTYAFTTLGIYPYFLANSPTVTGQVIVQPVPFDFTLTASPGSQSVVQGQSVTRTLYVTGTLGDPQSIALNVGGLPTDATWSLTPSSVVPTGTAMLAVTTTLTTPVNDYAVIITGTAAGQVHTTTATLSVNPHPDFTLMTQPSTQSVSQGESATYTVTTSSQYGFNQPVALDVTGLPSGASVNWSANPVTPTANSTLMIDASSNTPAGTYPLTINGTGGGFAHTTAATLTVTLHDGFNLNIAPDTVSIPQGMTATYMATVAGLYDFMNPVTLSVNGLPNGVNAAILPNPVTPTSTAAITLTSALTAPIGTYSLTLTGTGSGRVHSVPFTLTLTSHPDFALTAQPSAQNVSQGKSLTYTVAASALYGFNQPLTLDVTGLPAGVTPNWSANPITPTANSLLLLAVSNATPTGTYSLIIGGTGGGFAHTTPATLTITLHDGFSLNISPDATSIPQGAAAIYTATVAGLYDFTNPVTLSVSGLPGGVAATILPNPVIPTGTATISLTAALTSPIGTYGLSLIGMSSGRIHSVPLTLTLTPHPDFGVGLQPSTLNVRQSRAVTTTVSVSALYGFASPVTLMIGSLPDGASAQWDANPIAPDTATTLTLTTMLTTSLGSQSVMITGTGGGFIHAVPLTLTVQPHPDFVFTMTSPTQAITQGQSITYAAQLLGQNEWNAPVALSLADAPTGTVAMWLPDVLTPDGSSQLSISVSATTPVGTYPMTAIADGGLLSHTTPITLTVFQMPKSDLIIERLSTQPVTPTTNVPFTLSARVRNLGSAITQTFQVDWYLDPASTPITTTPGTGVWLVNGLDAGASSDLTVTQTFTDVGAHSFWAQVDRTNAVEEGNDNNNFNGPLVVNSGLPDLLPTSLATSPAIPIQGQPFTITSNVANQGIVDSADFNVDWYVDPPSPPISTTSGSSVSAVGGLSAQSSAVVSITQILSSIGIHSLWAQVDRLNVIEESNKNNNLTNQALLFVDHAPLAPTPFATPTPMPTPQPTPITGARQPIVYVPATITATTTWVSGTVYVIVGRVTLNAGVTLNIQSGTVVKFQTQTVSPYYKGRLTINGTLLAQGTADSPIIFTSIHDDAYGGDTNTNGGATWPNASDWDGLEFTNTSSGSVLDYARVTFGGGNGSNVQVTGTSVNLSHSIIGWGSGDGLRWLNGASGQIIGNQIGNNLGSGLNLTSSSSPIVHDNTIANNRTYAVYLDGSCFPDFDNNAVYGNAWNVAGVYGALGTGTWYSNLAYYVTQNLSIEAANALTIQPGTTVKFAANTNLIVRGTLVASGTVTSPIVFTSLKDDQYGGDTQQDGGATKPNNGDWGTLYFADTSNDADTILNHVIVRYGGAGYNYGSGTAYADMTLDSAGPRILNTFVERSSKYGLQLLNASSPLLQGNTIWENNDTALWLSSSSSPSVSGNAFVRNNGYAVYINGSTQATFDGNIAVGNKTNGIGVTGTINADTTWNSNLPFVIEGSVTLALNTTLNIQPDTVVKFTAGGKLIVNGWLQAAGTSDHRITFTSLKDDTIGGDTNNDGALTTPAAGNWESIRFMSTSSASALDYVSVRYGGSNATTGALIVDSSMPSLGHLIVLGSQYRGLYALNTSLLIDGGVFAQNGYGLYNDTTAYLIVHNSDIFSNTTYGLYNANTGYALNATGNWWGSATGPRHASNPSGTGDVVSNNVTFSPWSSTPPVTQPALLPTYPTPPAQTQVSGVIAVNTTWTVISSPYIIVSDVTVNAGVQLSIQPGVVVKFAAGKSLNINGILSAEGTSGAHIIFTSIKDDSVGGDSNADGSASAPARGDWGRITFGDTSVDALTKLRYAEVRYSGSLGSAIYINLASPTVSDNVVNQNSGYGLYISNSSSPTVQRNWIIDNAGGGIYLDGSSAGLITDNTIWGNTGYAVYMDTTCYPTFASNTAFYNSVNGVRVSGSVAVNETWYANLPYVIEGGVTINSGPALTLQPGTVVKFKDTSSYLTVNGALIATGLITNPIAFTSLRDDTVGGDTNNDDGMTWPLPGDWQRIYFADSSDDSRTKLQYTLVRYGGATYNQSVVADSAAPKILSNTVTSGSGYGLYLLNQANPQIQGNTFTQNGLSGLYLASASAPTINGNTFQRNKSYAVEMTADTKPRFSGNLALDNGTNGVYVSGTTSGSTTWNTDLTYVAGNVTIPSGASLTLSPGNVIKFASAANWTVNGPIYADGTSALSITLTSLKDDAYGGDTNNDNGFYPPASGDWGTITIGSTANASRFRHAIIRYGGDPTIKVSVSSLSVTDSVLDFNKRALWYDQSTGTITGTKFLSNTLYGLYETGSGLTILNDEFRYNNQGAYVATATGGHPTIDNNIFVDNYGYAIFFDFASYKYFGYNNALLYPGQIGNSIRVPSGTFTQNTSLVPNAVYWIDAWTVGSGVTMTILANTIIKFNGGVNLTVLGTLTATGTITQPVVFTSWKDDSYGGDSNADGSATAPARGDWYSIFINNGSVNLDYAIVQYGGGYPSAYYPGMITPSYGSGSYGYNANIAINHSTLRYSADAGLYVATNITAPVSLQNTMVFSNANSGILVSGGAAGALTITDNTFTNNGSDAIYLTSTQNRALTLSGNTITNNGGYAMILSYIQNPPLVFSDNLGSGNRYDVIYLVGSFGNLSLAPQGSMVYRFDSFVVPAGQTLTLQPGTIVKLSSTNLQVNGTLTALGTAGNPIVFTSWKDDSYGGDSNADGSATAPARGDWYSIFINNGSVNLDYAIVQYGGGYPSAYYPGMITPSYGSGSYGYNANIAINHSTLRYSADAGLYVATNITAPVSLQNTMVFSNANSGILVSGGAAGALTITDNTFTNNGSDAIYLTSTQNRALTLSGNTITNNGGYAMILSYIQNPPLVFSDNLGSGNRYDVIYLVGSFGNLSLAPQGSMVYRFDSFVVPAGQTLTLQPGTIVKLSSTNLQVNGTLTALGTAGNPIVFTSWKDDSYGGDSNADGSATAPARGDWYSIFINNGSVNLDYAIVQYGGGYPSAYYPGMITPSYGSGSYGYNANIAINHSTLRYSADAGLYVATNITAPVSLQNTMVFSNANSGILVSGGAAGALTITDNTFTNNGSDAIYLTSTQNRALTLSGNTITNNGGYAMILSYIQNPPLVFSDNLGSGNRYDVIYLVGSFGNLSLAPQGSMVYRFDSFVVPAGQTLTLQPGTIVKLSSTNLQVNGTLTALGTAGNPIVFTSWKDDSYGGDSNADGSATAPARGDWYSIFINNGSVNLDYAIVQYGGGYPSAYYPGMITPSYGSGSYGYNANIAINHSTLRYSADAGLYVAGNVTVNATVNNSNVYANTSYGIYNAVTNYTVDARYNWWGDASGPAPFGSGNGINYRTFTCGTPPVTCYDFDYYVHASPWFNVPIPADGSLPAGSLVVRSYNSSPSAFWSGWVAEPVNVVFGNYAYQHTDLAFPARGLGFAFERAYNSNVTDVSTLGLGWTHSYNITAAQTSTYTVVIHRADGRLDQFVGSGIAFTPPPGNHDTLAQIGSTFVLTQADQIVLTFDTSGRLASMKDRNNNTLTFGYSGGNLSTATMADGRVVNFTYTGSLLTGITDPAGRTVGFSYTGNLLTASTDTAGKITTYAYDGSNRLQSITDANGHTFVDNTYDTNGRVSQQYDALNDLTTFAYYTSTQQTVVVDPRGNPVTYTYDSAYRITNERDALGNQTFTQWDSDNNRSAVTDKRGNTMRYAYDARGNATTITDTLGLTRTFAYDARNNPTRSTDQLLHTTVYTYNITGNPITQADPAGNLTRWGYDAYGQVISQTDALSRTTRYANDLYGNRALITDAVGSTSIFTYDIVNRKVSATDARGGTTGYAYDAVNRLRVITDALGSTTIYTYDVVGNRIADQDALGRVTQSGYDAKDRVAVVTDTLGNATRFEYDANNNQIVVTDTLGHATLYGYDALNRRTSQTDPLGNVAIYQYDANGNLTSVTDPLGHATAYTFDALNRQTKVVDPVGDTITTTYTAVGNVLAVTDPNNHITTNAYDTLNRLVNVTDALSGVITYTYDAVGNRLGLIDANTHATGYAYDALNLIITVTDPLSNVTAYTYDANGNRTRTLDANGNLITTTFDALNHASGTQYADGTSVAYAYNAIGNRLTLTDSIGTTHYVYDNLNRPIVIAAPTGTVTYTYDAKNRIGVTTAAGTVTTTYDAADRMLTATDWASRVSTYTYDDAGRQVGITYPNGVLGAFAYDNANRPISLTYTSGLTMLASIASTLDAVGNRLSMTDNDGTTLYVYDALNRLTGVTYPMGSPTNVTYSYDPMGNRLMKVKDGVGTAYNYDAADRLLASTTSGVTTTFTWDNNGNQLAKGTQTFTWDKANRLVGLTNGATSASYQYNGDGVRVGRVVDGISTAYLQDQASGLPIVLRETTGISTTDYVYGTDQIASVDSTGTPAFYHADGLGSIRLLTDNSGSVADQYSYDAFGASRAHTGASGNPFTFAGEQVDPEAGLTYLRARYYDSQSGRFLSVDPKPGRPNLPQTFNRYVYVANNPINQTDPTGAIFESLVEKWNNITYNVTHPAEYIQGMKMALADPIARGFVLDEVSENAGIVGTASCAAGFGPGCAFFTGAGKLVDAANALDTARGIASGEVPGSVGAERAFKIGTGLLFDHVADQIAGRVGEQVWRYGTRAFGTQLGGFLGQATSEILSKGLSDLMSKFSSSVYNQIVNQKYVGGYDLRFSSGGGGGGGGGGAASGGGSWGGPPSGGK